MAVSEKHLENLHERLRNESATAETDWANATRAVAAARAKDDELRAEVKWRTAERAAADRAASEAESRHQLAKEALAQAEKQCMLAAAAATQKQSSLRQLTEFESAMQLQAKLIGQARAEVQQARSESLTKQQEVESLRQDLTNLRAMYDREKLSTQRHAELAKEHEALQQQLEGIRNQLAAMKVSNAELQASLHQEKVDREQLAAELACARSREVNLDGELAALRRALSCAKTEASILRAKLEAPPSSPRPAVADVAKVPGTTVLEMGTGMASRSSAPAPRGTPQDRLPGDPMAAWDFGTPRPLRSPLQPEPAAVQKPPEPMKPTDVAFKFEGCKRKLLDRPKDDVDDFPDTQEDEDVPEVKCPRLPKPAFNDQVVMSSHTPEPKRVREPTAKTWPKPVEVVPEPSGPKLLQNVQKQEAMAADEMVGAWAQVPAASVPRQAQTVAGVAACGASARLTPSAGPLSALQLRAQPLLAEPASAQLTHGTAGQPTATGRRSKRSKEEVLRLARSMYSTKPLPKQLRNPPLKLYPAHVDYVLTNWDKFPQSHSIKQPEALATRPPPARTTPSPTPTPRISPSPTTRMLLQRAAPPTPTSWQHVQHFLQAQAHVPPDSFPSMRVVSSVR